MEIQAMIVGEVDGHTHWRDALQGVDAVIHLAARAHILSDRDDGMEAEFQRVNVEGTIRLVQQSIQAGVKHFVFLSSIGAMASLSDLLLDERSPCRPDTPYGRSKLQAENALIAQAGQSGMTWTILRPTLVYGPGNPGNMERLIRLVNCRLPLPLGNITNRRSFLYVGNLVDVIARCLVNVNAKNEIFLVSDADDLSTPQLIKKVSYHMKRRCLLFSLPRGFLKILGYLGDALQAVSKRPIPFNTSSINRLNGSMAVDSTHIQSALNWRPPFTMDEGLALTVGSK
jgi:nucleoside-diphosphate-sugar epimerase